MHRLGISVGLGCVLLALCACAPSTRLDCQGTAGVAGRYAEINTGELEFRHGLMVSSADRHTVIFSDEPILIEAMQLSSMPLFDVDLAAGMFNELLVGFEFDAWRNYKQRITLGNSSSSGWSGADRGSFSIDEQGCARGDVTLDADDWGSFAVPVWRDPSSLELERGAVETAQAPAAAAIDDDQSAEAQLARWREAHARLMHDDPVEALQALGLSAGAASVLARDPRAERVLERVRTQCADPGQIRFDEEYGELVGPSPSHQGVVFQSTIQTHRVDGKAVLSNCYVMQRNEESLEQCWPARQDCRSANVWKP